VRVPFQTELGIATSSRFYVMKHAASSNRVITVPEQYRPKARPSTNADVK
jgi:hypothetical protein